MPVTTQTVCCGISLLLRIRSPSAVPLELRSWRSKTYLCNK